MNTEQGWNRTDQQANGIEECFARNVCAMVVGHAGKVAEGKGRREPALPTSRLGYAPLSTQRNENDTTQRSSGGSGKLKPSNATLTIGSSTPDGSQSFGYSGRFKRCLITMSH